MTFLCAKAFAGTPTNSSTIIFDATNNKVWNVNADTGTVTAISANGLPPTKLDEIAVGKNPRTLAQAPLDKSIWVVNQGDATITVIKSDDHSIVGTISLPRASMPYGIAFAPDGSAAFVSLQASGRLLKINPTAPTFALGLSCDVGPSPRGVAVSGNSARVFVSRFISPQNNGEVREVKASDMTLTSTITLAQSPGPDTSTASRGVPNYVTSLTISPDGARIWVPSKQDNTLRGQFRDSQPLTFETSVRTVISQIDISTSNGNEVTAARKDFDNSDMAQSVCFDVTGTNAYVALQGSNRVHIIATATNTTINAIDVGKSPDLGLAPQGVVVNGDSSRLFVNNFMSRTVAVYDISNPAASPIPLITKISAVATETLNAQVLLGKQIFYNAADTRMSRDGYISCASCHLDGDQDGRVWDFTDRGEGLRNTIILQGRSGVGQGPVHWTANFDEIQDFENDIRNAFQGTGFLTDPQFAATSDPLAAPKTGLSANLDALAAYVTSLTKVSKSPYRDYTTNPGDPKGQLTTDAQAGKLIFNSLNCVACHAGDAFTDSGTGGLHDVGTIKPGSGKRRNQTLTGFDTPTLKGAWETAPYLHDGSASTLLDVLVSQNASDLHGKTSTLTNTEKTQLVEYLLQIDGDEPGNKVPTVSITSPADNASFDLPPSITLTADASDDGSVTKVEFFDQSNNKIGGDMTAPFSVEWTNPAAGNYLIRAVATDNLTASATSTTIAITIKAQATVTLGNLTALFDGTPKSVTATTVPSMLTVDITYDGSPTPPSAAGQYAVVATINDASSFGTATGTLTIFPVLQFTSSPSAAPNPSIAGQPVLFNAVSNGIGLTYDWEFGDGSVATTNVGSVIHTYALMGSYNATVFVTQADNQTVQAPLSITVNPPDTDGDGITDNLDGDDDNDGVSDVNELADGTDPLSAGSAASIPMPVSKLLIGLNFATTGRDSLNLSGTIPSVPAIQNTNSMTATLDAGGAQFAFTLNGKGQAKLDKSKLTLKLKPGKRGTAGNIEFLGGDIAYKATIRGTFSSNLSDDGLVSQTVKDQSAGVLVKLTFNGRVYSQTVGGSYSAKAGKSGKFKK